MAPAASLALQAGYDVTGDDLMENHRTLALRSAGASIEIGKNTLPTGSYRAVVKSGAVAASEGNWRNTPVLQRLQFVQRVFSEKDVLAVCGSVGKSSAASIIHAAFKESKPSCYIGADIDGMLCGANLSAGPWAVTEACEYQDSYFALAPRMLILLNITSNHEDHFGNGTSGFSRSFHSLVNASYDVLDHVVLTEQAAATLRSHSLGVSGHTVGPTGEDWMLVIEDCTPYSTTFKLLNGSQSDRFSLPLVGPHSATAAGVAVIAARLAGLDDRAIQTGLDEAQLPDRRMSVVHSSERVAVYDDNARLPVQLASLLQALRQRHAEQRIIVLISPWGRRNRRDLVAWADVAAEYDHVYVLPVGNASTDHGGAEDPTAAIALAEMIEQRGGSAVAIDQVEEVVLPVDGQIRPDVYVTAGYDSNQAIFAAVHRHLML